MHLLLIADQTVYVDLELFSLCSNAEKVGVFINREIALALTSKNNQKSNPIRFLELTQVGASGIWDGQIWHVVNVGTTIISLLSDSCQIIQLPNYEFKKLIEQEKFKALSEETIISENIYSYLKHASVDDCIEASRRYSIITAYLQGEKADFSVIPERTFYRWVGNWRSAEEQYGYGYLGLLPKQKNYSPENQSKLSLPTQNLIDEFISNDYLNLKQKGKYAAYCTLQKACIDRGLIPPSYKTFVKNIKKVPQYETKLRRQGKRVAYGECFWHSQQIFMPQRSHLYPLQPLLLGTPFTESLTSYITQFLHLEI